MNIIPPIDPGLLPRGIDAPPTTPDRGEPGNPTRPRADTVQLGTSGHPSTPATYTRSGTIRSLANVQSLLDRLGGTASSTPSSGASPHQPKIDEMLSATVRAAESPPDRPSGPAFRIEDRSDAIEKLDVSDVSFPDGQQSIAADIEITQSAQRGKLFLDLGGPQIDLGGPGGANGSDENFAIELAGATGSKKLSFASGTSNLDMAAAINTFTDDTGVQASGSSQGVTLQSIEFGEDSFVSVGVLSDGEATGGGIVRFRENNANQIDPDSARSFEQGLRVRDRGQALGALVNGQPAETSGRSLSFDGEAFTARLALSPQRTQTLGAFDAFTLRRPDPGGG